MVLASLKLHQTSKLKFRSIGDIEKSNGSDEFAYPALYNIIGTIFLKRLVEYELFLHF